jgi:hypothetical protein
MNYNLENHEPPFKAALVALLFWVVLLSMVVISLVSCSPTHRPRLDKYDKDGLIKSSTPLYLDKKKSRKVKPTL